MEYERHGSYDNEQKCSEARKAGIRMAGKRPWQLHAHQLINLILWSFSQGEMITGFNKILQESLVN